MEEQQLFQQLSFWRNRLLDGLKKMPAEVTDVVPKGFNNHVLWNLGHIASSYDALVTRFVGGTRTCPEHFASYFAMGTKPAEWSGDIPTYEAVIEVMENQQKKIEENVSGKLSQTLPEPFLGMKTVGELLAFAISHEALHIGHIKSIAQAVAAQK